VLRLLMAKRNKPTTHGTVKRHTHKNGERGESREREQENVSGPPTVD